MESLSRPPHRRKHSNATSAFSSSFSLKNPYDGVLLSSGGKTKPFEAHEYSEIFSGSSSIPVLDLSALDERVGSGDGRSSSKLDYTNIFGGLRDDDVAVPYEELLNGGSAKKSSQPRISTDARSPSQESGSRHSSGKTKRSPPEASDQSGDGIKQQVNLSFNRTGQRDNDALNGKTHIAQLHAVPGFTYFVDGASRLQKTEDNRPIPSLKRGVSRTWSFSAELESVKGKGGLNGDKSRRSDNSLNENGVNLKSHFSKVPSHFSKASKQDASEKVSGESSPASFDEDFDENSVAAVSAAALKKAIDQAQESIRIAKIIMDKKKQGLQDGSKASSRGHLKVKDKKEAKIDHEGYGSKEKNVWERIERSDGKSISSLSHCDPLINAGKSDVERVRENVGSAKEHAEASDRESKISAPSCSQGEILRTNEKVEMEKLEKYVESAEADFRTANGEYVQVGNDNGFLLSTNKLASRIDEMEAVKEALQQKEVTTYHMKGSDFFEKPSEKTLDAPKRREEALGQCQDTFDHAEEPTETVELAKRVLDTSQRTPEQEKIVDEASENLNIIQENEVIEEKETVIDNEEMGEENFEEFKEMLNVEYLTVTGSEFDDSLNESGNLVEKEAVEQEEMEKKDDTVPEWKENSTYHGESDVEENVLDQKEAQIWFESEEQLKEALEEEINERKPEIDDKKQNHAYDENEQILPEKLEQNEVDERHTNMYEYESSDDVVTEANIFVNAKKSEVLCEAEETNNTVGEDNHNKCEFQEFAYEKDIDEAVDVNNSDTSTVFSESQEACDVDINDGAEDNLREEILSAIDMDSEADKLFHREDNEMPEIDILHRSVSEEVFFESKRHESSDGPIDNAKTEYFGDTEADHEAKLPNEDTLERISEIHEDPQECADKIDGQTLPQINSSNDKPEEFDVAYLRQVLEQTSESDEGSTSTSSVENIDSSSPHESEECAENANEKTSNDEKLKCEIEITSNESKYEERNEEMDKPTETETAVEKDLNVIKTKENLTGATIDKNAKSFDKSDHQQRIEAIKKGREREKDRIVVERAIREARERAFAEARERAERAAVEKAAAEVRQRAMSEAREKASVVNKQPADKASTEAKLRAERAAVERATAEARERALEKAMSQKTFSEAKTQADRYTAERVSSSSRNNGLEHSLSTSDLEKLDGSESAQRRKARLERHQRIMERAAKALAEKNMRDLLAQKEQAERNRLAGSLDADIKRWATGKEGNLRALLSTLQYILGADSSWQPISLTEIITTAAVKKAYRKATLYVHPDKLQQRGATIQQKYICEKVFDLLKAAWNRFNSEER